MIYVDVRVTVIPVARGLFKLVGEAGISLDFVSELSRTKSTTFPSYNSSSPLLRGKCNFRFSPGLHHVQ